MLGANIYMLVFKSEAEWETEPQGDSTELDPECFWAEDAQAKKQRSGWELVAIQRLRGGGGLELYLPREQSWVRPGIGQAVRILKAFRMPCGWNGLEGGR